MSAKFPVKKTHSEDDASQGGLAHPLRVHSHRCPCFHTLPSSLSSAESHGAVMKTSVAASGESVETLMTEVT